MLQVDMIVTVPAEQQLQVLSLGTTDKASQSLAALGMLSLPLLLLCLLLFCSSFLSCFLVVLPHAEQHTVALPVATDIAFLCADFHLLLLPCLACDSAVWFPIMVCL